MLGGTNEPGELACDRNPTAYPTMPQSTHDISRSLSIQQVSGRSTVLPPSTTFILGQGAGSPGKSPVKGHRRATMQASSQPDTLHSQPMMVLVTVADSPLL